MADVIEDTEGLVMLGLLAAAGVGLYWLWKNYGPPAAPGTPTTTTYEPTQLTFGNTYVTSGSLVTTSGQVLGTMATLSQAKDSAGNLYVYVNGGTWLAEASSGGNYTAIPVTQVNAPPGSTAAGGPGSTTFAPSNAPTNWGTT